MILTILFLTGKVDARVFLSGAGATFPSPFYEKLILEYQKKADVKIDYRKKGSGAGIAMLKEKKVDFGASDIFLSDEDLKKEKSPIVHIPTCIGAVAVIYNIPGDHEIKLDSSVLSGIFTGRIKKWNHSSITALNDGIQLDNLEISVIHRVESSGTNYIFTDYLSKTDSYWEKNVGCGKKVSWPVGMGVEENNGVAEMVKRIPGSIGYVSLNYAQKKGIRTAQIRNRAGRFIKPNTDSVSSAANINLPDDCRMMITDTAASDGYPISSFTYILVFREQAYGNRSREKADALVHFLEWIVDGGQVFAKSLDFSPLPKNATMKALRAVKSITYNP